MDESIIGTTVDGYRIREVIGQGGMGVVYRARDVSLARDVALKRISPKLADDEPFLRRFRSEAQALARLDSPHIVSVYALRQTEIGLLIVMEYVEGGTLKELIRQGPMAWQDALPFIEQILTGLEHAHGADVIHRDIKPGNILLTASGTVKVTDFGLAKVYRPDSDQTVTQGVHGTLKYMSPEQVQGRADLDPRSDLFSVGMTVYEMLAGRLPFDEEDSEFSIMQTIVEETLPRPDRYRSEIPDAFVSAIMKSLAKDPDDRFDHAPAMREAFNAAANRQEETSDTNTAEVVQAARASSSGRSRVRVVGVGLLILLMAIGGYFMHDMMVDGSGGDTESPSPDSPSVTKTGLSIESHPAGATVYHSGRRVGVTPLDYTVEEDSAQLRVRKAGFRPVDTTLGLGTETTVDLDIRLQREVQQTDLEVATAPSGAVVYVNGDSIGVTPLGAVVTGPSAHVRVRKPGYLPVDTMPVLSESRQVRLDLQLSTPTPDPAPTPRGVVDVGVQPRGTVIVDGERYEGSASVELPVGRHRIQFRHPEYGGTDTTITVQEGETEVLTTYFEQTIRVRSPEHRGTVVLGGTNLGTSPPHQLSRGPGTHRVGLRIEQDPLQTVPGGVYVQQVEGREIKRREFSGSEREVRITPSFSPKTHVVTFRVQSLAEQLRGRVDGLKENMKRAIKEQRWDLLPDRLARSCQDALAALYEKHEITSVRVVANEVRRDSASVVLPFETYITYRQKGREGTKYIPLSTVTVWAPRNGDVQLIGVRRTEIGGS